MRDVGAEIGYTWNVGFPIVVNVGIFNGSGLTNQKDYWTKGNSAKDENVMIVSGRNVYDAFGRVAKSFYPTTEGTGSKSTK